MDDSNMEMTSICSTNRTTGDMLITQEQYEALFQENQNLEKKIDMMESVNCDLENELTCLSDDDAKFQSKLKSQEDELDCAYVKIKQSEILNEDEDQKIQLLKESYDKLLKEEPEKKAVIAPGQEQLKNLTEEIENLETLHMENQDRIRCLQAEQSSRTEMIRQLKCEKEAVGKQRSEIKEIIRQKTIDIRNLNQTLESVQEDTLLINTELQILKTSETHAAGENSVFAELEENRQKAVAHQEVLKLKYIELKKVLNQKQFENNKLKMEIVKIRREEKDDEKSFHRDYPNLMNSYKERISELEAEVMALEQHDNPPIDGSDENTSRLNLVNTVIEHAKNKTQALKAELNRRGSNYVFQRHQLLDSQKENRRLKATASKLQSELDELRNQDKIISAIENLDGGISPAATDMPIESQRKKTVTFNEVLHKKSDTSLPSDKESDKENQNQEEPFILNDSATSQCS